MDADNVVAGLFLLLFGLLGIVAYVTILLSMAKMCRDIVGFRFLISQAATDVLLMIQFGVWPGAVILLQNEIIPVSWRFNVHIWLDFTWSFFSSLVIVICRWAMVYHYSIVAWSRLAAVRWPNWFRTLPYSTCVLICSLAWIIGLVQSLVEHQFPWFEHLYYSPEHYGMHANWKAYADNGTATYYMIINTGSMILPFPFYGAAICVLFKRQKKQAIEPGRHRPSRGSSITPSSILLQRQLSIETRLLIPCIINTLLFVVFITLCSNSGKWMNFAVMVAFATNSFINPILYVCFSSVIRREVFSSCRKRLSSSAVYRDYDYRSSSQTLRSFLLQVSVSFQQQRLSLVHWKKESVAS